MSWNKNVELELRKRAVVFDKEIISWMEGLIVWMILFIAISLIGIFIKWMLVGEIIVGVWVLWAINKAMKVKKSNLKENEKVLGELKNAK